MRRFNDCRVAVGALVVMSVMALLAGTVFAQGQRPATVDDFVSIDQLPPAEQMAAAPLLVAAYCVVIVVLFLYVFSVARRLTAVQREVERLEGDVKRAGRS